MRTWSARYSKPDGWWYVSADDGTHAERIESEEAAQFIVDACNEAEERIEIERENTYRLADLIDRRWNRAQRLWRAAQGLDTPAQPS